MRSRQTGTVEMTFVLNVLHKDFSLVASDRRGMAAEAVTMNVGGISIRTVGGGVIDGIKKSHLNANKRVCVSYAGNVSDHSYIEKTQEQHDPENIVKLIRAHAENQFDFASRADLVSSVPKMQNQAIATFFDEQTSSFFTTYHSFTPYTNYNETNVRHVIPRPILIHLGNGSSSFESSVGLEKINSFINDIESGISVEDMLLWIDEAFALVSKPTTGCSEEYDAVIATRDDPEFRVLRSTDVTTFRLNA
jgi:hypothetical protein